MSTQDINITANYVYTLFEEVTIGTQTWMAVNLDIDDGLGGIYAYNNDENNVATYGRLYTWNAALRVAASIDGWHLPSDSELNTLLVYVGGAATAGVKLKEEGDDHWVFNAVYVGTDDYGFTALPGGVKTSTSYVNITKYGYWWYTSSGNNIFTMGYVNHEVSTSILSESFGLSVRLIKD